MPPEGLRTQANAATGSGKTLIVAESAQRLSARRVLVLVPTLDLLTQMAARGPGQAGAMIGVCSLRAEESQGLPCTTDLDELSVAVTAGPRGCCGVPGRGHTRSPPVVSPTGGNTGCSRSGTPTLTCMLLLVPERLPSAAVDRLESRRSAVNSALLSVRSALVLLLSILCGTVAGVLTAFTGVVPAEAVLSGMAGLGVSVSFFNALID